MPLAASHQELIACKMENWVLMPLLVFKVLCYHALWCVFLSRGVMWQVRSVTMVTWSQVPMLPALCALVVCIIASSGCVCPLAGVSCVTRDPHRDSVTLVTVWNIGGKLEKYVKHHQPASAAPGCGRAAALTCMSRPGSDDHLVVIIRDLEILWV